MSQQSFEAQSRYSPEDPILDWVVDEMRAGDNGKAFINDWWKRLSVEYPQVKGAISRISREAAPQDTVLRGEVAKHLVALFVVLDQRGLNAELEALYAQPAEPVQTDTLDTPLPFPPLEEPRATA